MVDGRAPSCAGNAVLLEPSGLHLVLFLGCSREDAGADAFHAPAAPSHVRAPTTPVSHELSTRLSGSP